MFKIRFGASYWNGTAIQITKWATEECYNEVQRNRQAAAKAFLVKWAPRDYVL